MGCEIHKKKTGIDSRYCTSMSQFVTTDQALPPLNDVNQFPSFCYSSGKTMSWLFTLVACELIPHLELGFVNWCYLELILVYLLFSALSCRLFTGWTVPPTIRPSLRASVGFIGNGCSAYTHTSSGSTSSMERRVILCVSYLISSSPLLAYSSLPCYLLCNRGITLLFLAF